jgi:hypothetical protein
MCFVLCVMSYSHIARMYFLLLTINKNNLIFLLFLLIYIYRCILEELNLYNMNPVSYIS